MTELARCGAVVLAAGQSLRFGDTNKLAAILNGKPLLAHSLTTLCSLDLSQVVVISGSDCQQITEIATPFEVELITNPDYKLGMGNSLSKGMRQMSPSLSGIFIVLADMPFVTSTNYKDLTDILYKPSDICRPTFNFQLGNPVLFGQNYFEDLKNIMGDQGARGLLSTFSEHVKLVPSTTCGVLEDFDLATNFPHI